MAYSYNDFGSKSPGDTITVSFPFRNRDEVFVTVGGVDVSSSLYSWVNDGLISCGGGFPAGAGRVERRTPVAEYDSEQSGSSVYDWLGVNGNFEQNIFVLQEYVDGETERDAKIEAISGNIEVILDARDEAVAAKDVAVGLTDEFTGIAATKINLSEKGAANGVAPLDAQNRVGDPNLPDRLKSHKQITDADQLLSPGWAIGQNALHAPTNAGPDDWYTYSFEGSSAGPTGVQRARQFFDGKEYLRTVLNGVWSAWQRDYAGDQLDARFVKFHPDTSTTVGSTQRVRVGVNDGRIEAIIAGSENNGWFNSVNPIGRAGGMFGSVSADNPTVGDSGTYGSGNFVIHNSNKSAWAGYDEIRVEIGAAGGSGREINPVNRKPLVANDPYNIYAPNSVTALLLSSGRGDVTGCTPLSSYLNIQANGAAADKGINFGYNAVTINGGQADVINFAKNHALQWWTATGFRGAAIRGDVIDSTKSLVQIFEDSSVRWRLRDAGLDTFQITTTLATSYVPIKFPQFLKATKPSPSVMGSGSTIDITNDTSNRRLATSDGTNWRFQDGTIVPAS